MSKSNSIPQKDKKPAGILPRTLLRQIGHVHRLAQESGLFLNDRELLRCDSCGVLGQGFDKELVNDEILAKFF